MQYHEIIRMEDPDRVLRRRTARWRRCWRRRRRARSATSASPATRTRWCTCACWRWRPSTSFHFDAAQMPLNVLDAHFRSFAHDVVPKLVKQGIGVLGMKPMASGGDSAEQDRDRHRVPALCAEPADLGGDHRVRQHGAAGPGVRSGAHVQADDEGAVVGAAGAHARRRRCRASSSSSRPPSCFDGTARHPQWMG